MLMAGAVSVIWFAGSGSPSICWKESADGSEQRRAWTSNAASFLKNSYASGAGVFFSFGDLTGALRQAGIPIHEGLYQDNTAAWDAAIARPDLFLHEDWALARSGDAVAQAAKKAGYRLHWRWPEKGDAVVELYRR
jgi:hypothetical protein